MTAFIVVCAAMLAAALLWLTVPLLRAKPVDDEPPRQNERIWSAIALVLVVPMFALLMYRGLSNWDWDAKPAATAAHDPEADKLIAQLQAKLAARPDDIAGWLLLGRGYVSTGDFRRGRDAYQRAYDLSQGSHPEALIGLAEALTLMDENALRGRAGKLIEQALQLTPNQPKALWYGSMAALQAGDLAKGRDRLKLLLAQNPPPQLRNILERQVQDLDQQLGDSSPPAEIAQRSIHVAVTLAPALVAKIDKQMLLFVLARDPQAPGPPLAVQRHTAAQLPLAIELSERDAMMPSRTIATVPRVQVVARLSPSGTPQAQSGDFYGQADYDFNSASGTLQIVIDKIVP